MACRKMDVMLTYCILLISFIHSGVTKNLVIIEGECLDSTVEDKEERASVVVSARVLELFKNRRDATYSANIQIKRVFKGDEIIAGMPHLKLSHKSVYGNYNKVVKLVGLGNSEICDSDVMKRDSKIFFLDYSEKARALEVASSVIPISMYNLKRVEAAVRNVAFNEPPPTKSPCIGHFCAFHAVCQVNATSQQPYCQCLESCEDDLVYPVCGTDGQTYSNECQLRLASCYRQKRIKVQYESICHNPCEKIECSGQQVCEIEDHKPICRCQKSCDGDEISPLCGSDGKTYSNQCLLKQQACRLGRDISALYDGKCRGSPD